MPSALSSSDRGARNTNHNRVGAGGPSAFTPFAIHLPQWNGKV